MNCCEKNTQNPSTAGAHILSLPVKAYQVQQQFDFDKLSLYVSQGRPDDLQGLNASFENGNQVLCAFVHTCAASSLQPNFTFGRRMG